MILLYLSILYPNSVCGKYTYDYNASLISVCNRPFAIDRWLRILGYRIAIAFSGDGEVSDTIGITMVDIAILAFDGVIHEYKG